MTLKIKFFLDFFLTCRSREFAEFQNFLQHVMTS